jgi:hypothetical protein
MDIQHEHHQIVSDTTFRNLLNRYQSETRISSVMDRTGTDSTRNQKEQVFLQQS